MANVERIMKGFKYIKMPVDSATVIAKGDFICRASSSESETEDYACTPPNVADAGTADQNEAACAAQFVGISCDASASGDTDDILVCVEGLVKLTLASASAVPVLDPIGMYAADTNTACTAQTCQETSTANEIIAICAETQSSASETTVFAYLKPILLNPVHA